MIARDLAIARTRVTRDADLRPISARAGCIDAGA